MPRYLWAECVSHECWVLNSLSTRALDFKSPHKVRYGKPRNIAGLPEWGAPCYVFDDMGKLSPNAERVHWMGYDSVLPTKGHCVYWPMRRKVTSEAAVRFLREEPGEGEAIEDTVDGGHMLWDDPDETETEEDEAAQPEADADPSASSDIVADLPPAAPLLQLDDPPAPAPLAPNPNRKRSPHMLSGIDMSQIVDGPRA